MNEYNPDIPDDLGDDGRCLGAVGGVRELVALSGISIRLSSEGLWKGEVRDIDGCCSFPGSGPPNRSFSSSASRVKSSLSI